MDKLYELKDKLMKELEDYSQNGMDNTHVFNDINFNRADNVNTNLTINLNVFRLIKCYIY